MRYLAAPWQVFLASAPALLFSVFLYRLAAADDFDSESIQETVQSIDWVVIAVSCFAALLVALIVAHANRWIRTTVADGKYSENPHASFMEAVAMGSFASLVFAFPLSAASALLALFAEKSTFDKFWPAALIVAAVEIISVYRMTHRGKRAGIVHVHARLLLVAVVITIATLMTIPIMAHSPITSFRRPNAGVQALRGRSSLVFGSTWLALLVGRRRSEPT